MGIGDLFSGLAEQAKIAGKHLAEKAAQEAPGVLESASTTLKAVKNGLLELPAAIKAESEGAPLTPEQRLEAREQLENKISQVSSVIIESATDLVEGIVKKSSDLADKIDAKRQENVQNENNGSDKPKP